MRLNKGHSLFIAFCAMSVVALSGAADAVSAPVLGAGNYRFDGSSNNLCTIYLDSAHDSFGPGTFVYAGPGKPGSSLVSTKVTSSVSLGIENTNTIATINLPTAPAATSNTWSGAFTGIVYQYLFNGVVGKGKTTAISGSFSIAFTALTDKTFYGSITLQPKGQSSCTLQVVGGP